MEQLIEIFHEKMKRIKAKYQRDFAKKIDWNDRLIGVKGARGVGKTTLLMQRLKQMQLPSSQAVYVSLDELWFTENKLVDLARTFVQKGGKYLFLDEVHKYKNWSQEIKNIYDTWTELHIVFTGSSMLHIHDARTDLSRRAMVYTMQGLSFREYLNISQSKDYQSITLENILSNHIDISMQISGEIKPLTFFYQYLKNGYYPYFLENENNYLARLRETVLYTLEIDLVHLRQISTQHIDKLKKLLYVLSQSVPYTPNILKLSEQIGVSRNTLMNYLQYLHEAELFILLFSKNSGNQLMQKPDKMYLHNTNIYYALAGNDFKNNIGAVRETFFVNQLSQSAIVNYTETGDFLVNENYIFEVGGRNKGFKQIANLPNSYLAVDEKETGVENKIPLWLFGFLM